MSRRRNTSASASHAGSPGGAAKRSWLRLLSLALAPLLTFGLLEMSLRISGFGYPTQFLLESVQDTRSVLVQNNDFSRRFLGSRLARVPCSFSLPVPKPAN